MLGRKQLLKAMTLKNAEELIAYAKTQGIVLSRDEAIAYIAEMSDIELTSHEILIAGNSTDPCSKNRLCIGDSSCGGGRHWHTSIQDEQTTIGA